MRSGGGAPRAAASTQQAPTVLSAAAAHARCLAIGLYRTVLCVPYSRAVPVELARVLYYYCTLQYLSTEFPY